MSNKTLYVVGAGASNEANLPTGAQLKNKIADLLNIQFNDDYTQSSGDRIIADAYRLHVRKTITQREDINPLMEAGWHIRDAMPQVISIDNFIDIHKDDEKIELCGKLAIVRSILDAEKQSLLYIDNSNSYNTLDYNSLSNTWYSRFMMLLTENCPKEDLPERLSSISLIVFNYDRCIEHFLYNSLQNTYKITAEESANLINNLEIFHPYGVVGNLPWQHGVSIQFGAKPQANQLLDLVEQIKTFTEGTNPDSSEIISIRKNVTEANKIVFLGFAYHKLNLKLISPTDNKNSKFGNTKYYGTAQGISDSDCEIIKSELTDIKKSELTDIKKSELTDIKKSDTYVKNINNKLSCNKLFDEYWRSLSLN